MRLTKRLTFHEGEEVVAVVRRSLLVFAARLFFGAALVVLAFFLIVPLFSSGIIGSIGFAVLLAVGLVIFSRALSHWYGTAFVVTNLRVVDLDQSRLFHRTIAEARFDRIEDISVRVHGLASTILRLGNVRIQASSGSTLLELRHVHAPERVHELLSTLQHHTGSREAVRVPEDLRALSTSELSELRTRVAREAQRRQTRSGAP